MLQTLLLVIHLLIAIGLVGVVLLQRSEGGALGIGGGGSGLGLMSGRGAANLLTRVTAVLAALFMAMSLVLAILAGNRGDGGSSLDFGAPVGPASIQQQAPAQPSVPLSE